MLGSVYSVFFLLYASVCLVLPVVLCHGRCWVLMFGCFLVPSMARYSGDFLFRRESVSAAIGVRSPCYSDAIFVPVSLLLQVVVVAAGWCCWRMVFCPSLHIWAFLRTGSLLQCR